MQGSVTSLAAGAGSGGIILALEYFARGSPAAGSRISLAQAALAAVLMYVMYMRYTGSGKFMPAGMVATLSGAAFVVYAARGLGVVGAKAD